MTGPAEHARADAPCTFKPRSMRSRATARACSHLLAACAIFSFDPGGESAYSAPRWGAVGKSGRSGDDVVPHGDTLEAGDDDHATGGQVGTHAGVVDALDAGLGVGRIGADRHLPAGIADGLHAFGLQRQRQQPHRDLLAGAGDHVELAGDGRRLDSRRDILGQAEQAIGLAAHRRRNDHHLVAGAGPLGHALGDVADALGRAHRRAAVLVNDQSHECVARAETASRSGVAGQPLRVSCLDDRPPGAENRRF